MQLEPQNADLHMCLSSALVSQLKYDEAIKAAREAVSLNPRSETAHVYLGIALREESAQIVDPTDLGKIWKAAEAGPKVVNESDKADWDGYRKIRLDEAIAEFRLALRLNPDDDMAHFNLGIAFVTKGDVDAPIAEYREALRLNPSNDQAHVGLAYVLGGSKRDLDGAVAEMRTAVQLEPDNPWHHHDLAHWLETKGDRQGALEEYRTAYTLDPQNSILRGFYETFLRETNAAR